jgi:hypothetical protein
MPDTQDQRVPYTTEVVVVVTGGLPEQQQRRRVFAKEAEALRACRIQDICEEKKKELVEGQVFILKE